MAAGVWTFYNNWKAAIGKAVDLSSDTIKMTLHTSSYTPSAAHSVYADLTNELSTANGYTSGGATVANQAYTQNTGTGKFTFDPVVWTASGTGIVARYAVLRASGTFNTQIGPLISYCLLDTTPGDVTASNGNTFTVTENASGTFTLV